MFTITLGHLLERGVSFQRYEALAIAQELIARGEGVPSANNVQLSSDGSVTCINTNGTPAVAEVAGLLQTLLPASPGQTPAPLRYTLARGLGAVEAPPFESLEAFSQSLARFEAGDRRGIIRSLLQRVASAGAGPAVAPAAGAVAVPAAAIAVPAVVPASERVVAPAPAAVLASAPATVVASAPAAVVASAPAAVVPPAPTAVVTSAPAAVVASAPLAPPPVAVVTRPVQPVLAPRPRTLDARAQAPAHARSKSPLNWRVAVLAVAASFALGVIGGEWAGLWQPRAMGGERPTAAEPSAGRPPAETMTPKSRATERPVSTTGSGPATPFTEVAVTPAQPTPEPAPRDDVASAELPANDAPVPVIRGESESAFSPAFGNTGSAMFFHTGGAGDPSSAIAMTPDASSGSNGELRIIKVLDDGARNYHPRPSPDGRLIAFDSDRDGERGVYVANGNGTQVRRISGDGYAAAPTWSPDGKRLTYIRAEAANPRVWNLWVQALGSDRATRVTAHQFGQTWSASWFPDNKRICYTHEDKVIVRDLSTGESRQFASPIAGRIVRTPAVSPDGTKVVFQVFRNGGWLLDLADGSMRRVLSDPTAEEFAWAPDGNRIAFHSRRTGEWSIYVVAPG